MSTRTVIVVDDDPSNLEAIADSLRDYGFRVEAVIDPQSAAAVARRTPRPCVLLVDLMMPVVSGADLIAQLRADPVTADLPVISCSAGLGTRPPGATTHLSKPFTIEELLAVVSGAFAASPSEARI